MAERNMLATEGKKINPLQPVLPAFEDSINSTVTSSTSGILSPATTVDRDSLQPRPSSSSPPTTVPGTAGPGGAWGHKVVYVYPDLAVIGGKNRSPVSSRRISSHAQPSSSGHWGGPPAGESTNHHRMPGPRDGPAMQRADGSAVRIRQHHLQPTISSAARQVQRRVTRSPSPRRMSSSPTRTMQPPRSPAANWRTNTSPPLTLQPCPRNSPPLRTTAALPSPRLDAWSDSVENSALLPPPDDHQRYLALQAALQRQLAQLMADETVGGRGTLNVSPTMQPPMPQYISPSHSPTGSPHKVPHSTPAQLLPSQQRPVPRAGAGSYGSPLPPPPQPQLVSPPQRPRVSQPCVTAVPQLARLPELRQNKLDTSLATPFIPGPMSPPRITAITLDSNIGNSTPPPPGKSNEAISPTFPRLRRDSHPGTPTQLPPLPSDHPNYCPPSPLDRPSPSREVPAFQLSADHPDASVISQVGGSRAPGSSDMVLVLEEVTTYITTTSRIIDQARDNGQWKRPAMPRSEHTSPAAWGVVGEYQGSYSTNLNTPLRPDPNAMQAAASPELKSEMEITLDPALPPSLMYGTKSDAGKKQTHGTEELTAMRRSFSESQKDGSAKPADGPETKLGEEEEDALLLCDIDNASLGDASDVSFQLESSNEHPTETTSKSPGKMPVVSGLSLPPSAVDMASSEGRKTPVLTPRRMTLSQIIVQYETAERVRDSEGAAEGSAGDKGVATGAPEVLPPLPDLPPVNPLIGSRAASFQQTSAPASPSLVPGPLGSTATPQAPSSPTVPPSDSSPNSKAPKIDESVPPTPEGPRTAAPVAVAQAEEDMSVSSVSSSNGTKGDAIDRFINSLSTDSSDDELLPAVPAKKTPLGDTAVTTPVGIRQVSPNRVARRMLDPTPVKPDPSGTVTPSLPASLPSPSKAAIPQGTPGKAAPLTNPSSPTTTLLSRSIDTQDMGTQTLSESATQTDDELPDPKVLKLDSLSPRRRRSFARTAGHGGRSPPLWHRTGGSSPRTGGNSPRLGNVSQVTQSNGRWSPCSPLSDGRRSRSASPRPHGTRLGMDEESGAQTIPPSLHSMPDGSMADELETPRTMARAQQTSEPGTDLGPVVPPRPFIPPGVALAPDVRGASRSGSPPRSHHVALRRQAPESVAGDEANNPAIIRSRRISVPNSPLVRRSESAPPPQSGTPSDPPIRKLPNYLAMTSAQKLREKEIELSKLRFLEEKQREREERERLPQFVTGSPRPVEADSDPASTSPARMPSRRRSQQQQGGRGPSLPRTFVKPEVPSRLHNRSQPGIWPKGTILMANSTPVRSQRSTVNTDTPKIQVEPASGGGLNLSTATEPLFTSKLESTSSTHILETHDSISTINASDTHMDDLGVNRLDETLGDMANGSRVIDLTVDRDVIQVISRGSDVVDDDDDDPDEMLITLPDEPRWLDKPVSQLVTVTPADRHAVHFEDEASETPRKPKGLSLNNLSDDDDDGDNDDGQGEGNPSDAVSKIVSSPSTSSQSHTSPRAPSRSPRSSQPSGTSPSARKGSLSASSDKLNSPSQALHHPGRRSSDSEANPMLSDPRAPQLMKSNSIILDSEDESESGEELGKSHDDHSSRSYPRAPASNEGASYGKVPSGTVPPHTTHVDGSVKQRTRRPSGPVAHPPALGKIAIANAGPVPPPPAQPPPLPDPPTIPHSNSSSRLSGAVVPPPPVAPLLGHRNENGHLEDHSQRSVSGGNLERHGSGRRSSASKDHRRRSTEDPLNRSRLSIATASTSSEFDDDHSDAVLDLLET